jgi:hypothetical protein
LVPGAEERPWATPWTPRNADGSVNTEYTPMQTTPKGWDSDEDDFGSGPGPTSPWSAPRDADDDDADGLFSGAMPVSPLLSPQTPTILTTSPTYAHGEWGPAALVSPRAAFGATYAPPTTPAYNPDSPGYYPNSPGYAPNTPGVTTAATGYGQYVPFSPAVGPGSGPDPALGQGQVEQWYNPANPDPLPPRTGARAGARQVSTLAPVGYTPSGWG